VTSTAWQALSKAVNRYLGGTRAEAPAWVAEQSKKEP
jgi:hypothetical protein